MFSTILKLIKRSLPIECEILEENPSIIPPSKQAFSKARYSISHKGFQEVTDQQVTSFYNSTDSSKWREHIVIGADGSALRLPDTETVEEMFDQGRLMNKK